MRTNKDKGEYLLNQQSSIVHSTQASNLADILERILDKGIVIAGDIQIKIADIELLTINIRLLIASVDKAQEMGINWWQGNPFLSSLAREKEKAALDATRNTAQGAPGLASLQQRIEALEGENARLKVEETRVQESRVHG